MFPASMRPHLVNAEAFDKRTITACRAQGYGAQPTERPASSHPCLLLRPLSLRRQSRGEAGVVCSIISRFGPTGCFQPDVPLYRCPNCSGPILADKVPLLLKSALPISSGKARRSAPASTHFSSCPTRDGSPAGFVMMGASMRNKCGSGHAVSTRRRILIDARTCPARRHARRLFSRSSKPSSSVTTRPGSVEKRPFI